MLHKYIAFTAYITSSVYQVVEFVSCSNNSTRDLPGFRSVKIRVSILIHE